jgi:transporter family-2 protein
MTDGYHLGLVAAFGTGIVFAFVTVFEGVLGKAMGSVNAAIMEHMFGGLISVVVFVWVLTQRAIDLKHARTYLPLAALMGLLVLIAVMGVTYSFPKIGFATGNFLLVMAQISTAVLIDAVGVGGFERIPITIWRVLGFGLMGLGVYFVLPK